MACKYVQNALLGFLLKINNAHLAYLSVESVLLQLQIAFIAQLHPIEFLMNQLVNVKQDFLNIYHLEKIVAHVIQHV